MCLEEKRWRNLLPGRKEVHGPCAWNNGGTRTFCLESWRYRDLLPGIMDLLTGRAEVQKPFTWKDEGTGTFYLQEWRHRDLLFGKQEKWRYGGPSLFTHGIYVDRQTSTMVNRTFYVCSYITKTKTHCITVFVIANEQVVK